jgi:PAS domain S-box-containing protein
MPMPLLNLRTRVARRILLLFILCAFAPIGTLAVLSYVRVESQLSDQAAVLLRQMSKEAGLMLLQRLDDVDDVLRVAATRLSAGRAPLDSVDRSLEPAVWITALTLAEDTTSRRPLLGHPHDPPAYTAAWTGDLDAGRAILVFRDTTSLWLGRAAPLARDGAHGRRLLWAEVSAAGLFGFDRSTERLLPAGTILCVLTSSGTLVYCPQGGPTERSSSTWQAGGTEYLSSRWPLFLRGRFSAEPLTMIVSEPRGAALGPVSGFRRTFPLIVVLTLAFALLLGAIVIRRNTEPLAQLQEGTRRLAALDFSSPVHIASGDEFETLAGSFNTMAERLRDELSESARLNTALERASESLRESETRLRTILDTAADAIVITNAAGAVESVNQAAGHVFGYRSEDIIGQRAVELFLDAGARPGDDPFCRPGPVREVLGRRKDGTTFPMELLVSPAEVSGRVLFTGFARDVTERKRGDEERASLEAQLRQAQKLETIGTLAGGIAHDFNNILAAVLGYLHLALEQVAADSPVRADLLEVERAAGRATELARQILIFSRRTEPRRRPVMVDEIVTEVLKLLRASLPATIEIQRRIEPETPPVDADPTQLHQVLLNLCTNAAHAMPQGGVLEVGLAFEDLSIAPNAPATLTAGRYIRLTVRDTGHGMDRATKDRIFEPFFTTKPPGEGTGLGLSVVHGIVTSHGGAIGVESAPEVGTTFTIYLPVGSSTERPSLTPAAAPPQGREHLLVVDDDEAVATVTRRVLERAGYNVTMRTSSVAALALLSAGARYDLLLTDQTMPGLTGMQLALAAHRLRPDLPIILSTGYADVPDAEQRAAVGIREVLMKPANLQDLAWAVRRALGSPAPEQR